MELPDPVLPAALSQWAAINNSICIAFAVWSPFGSSSSGTGASASFTVTLLDVRDYLAWKATGFQVAGGISFTSFPCKCAYIPFPISDRLDDISAQSVHPNLSS